MPRNINFCFTNFKPLPSPESTIKNFNSLFDFNIDCSAATVAGSSTSSDGHHSSSENENATPVDLATAFASRRFFFSSPGTSNSIIDSTSSVSSSLASTSSSSLENPPDSDSVAVPTYSADPFADFRRSMQEMVEARNLIDVKSNWDYLHELLMRYLSLNPKSTHKFIMGAFSDLLVSMMTSPPKSGHQKSISQGKCKISQQHM